MKIRSTDLSRVNTAKVKKSEVKGGSFQELLHTRLDGINPKPEHNHSDEEPKNTGNTLGLIEDAALMLDKALEQIQQNGQPSEEITHSLNLLRDQLKQACPDSDNLKAADAIIAVETNRLQSWNL
jgi:uncharacterized membrane protein